MASRRPSARGILLGAHEPRPQRSRGEAVTDKPERGRPGSGEGHACEWPSGLSVAIGRALGTVVVTVRGALEDCAAEPLGRVLRDLVENQGNRTVVIDLRSASGVSAAVREVFVAADASARARGSSLCLHGYEDLRPVPEGRTYLRASLE